MPRVLREQKEMGYSRPLRGSRTEKVTSYSSPNPLPRGGSPLHLSIRLLILILIGLLLVGCTDMQDEPTPSPTATASLTPAVMPTFTPTPTSTLPTSTPTTSRYAVEVGDCVSSTGLVAPCNNYRHKVWKIISYDGQTEYPGVAKFQRDGDTLCPSFASWYYHPTRTSWAEGDRSLLCTQ